MITFFETGGNLLNQPKGKPLYLNLPAGSHIEPDDPKRLGPFYEIRIKGQLSDIWADWFEGMTIRYLENGEMLLFGYITDQSALMGILNKLNRLNLSLLSVNECTKPTDK